MWGYMVCVIVKATKHHASLESLGQSRPQLLEELTSVALTSVYCLASLVVFFLGKR